jgi:GNAT superfamily N-acetyltransferase
MIRSLKIDDLAAVKALIEANELFPPDLLDDMTAPYFAGAANGEFWLTDDDGGPVGIAYCAPERMTEGTWNLLLITVHPDRQGQGRGTAFLSHVEHALAQRGERVLLVETSGLPGFERTRTFYRNNGYTEEARIRDYYQAGEDKIVFHKALAAGRKP